MRTWERGFATMAHNSGSGSEDDRKESLDEALRRLGEGVLAEPVPERLLRVLREARGRAGSRRDADESETEVSDAEDGKNEPKNAED